MAEQHVTPLDTPGVHGFLHQPETPTGEGLVLTHGAGSNCNSPLLRAVAAAFCDAGVTVLRCDLAFRRRRPEGPPSPATAAEDRAGLAEAVTALRALVPGPIVLGGHSYGGRQASMLSAEKPEIAAALLLLSYPLHPPHHPDKLRVAHFGQLRVPVLFVHGTRDTFGTTEELGQATVRITAPVGIMECDKAGHELQKGNFDPAAIVSTLRALRDGAHQGTGT